MPHYHNFGWYYFAKYILGLAGMIFLYTGFLKEKSVVCVCPAEERERARGKNNPNNDSSAPTGPIDAPAKTAAGARNFAGVDVKNEKVQTTTKRRNLSEGAARHCSRNPSLANSRPISRHSASEEEKFGIVSRSLEEQVKINDRGKRRRCDRCNRWKNDRSIVVREDSSSLLETTIDRRKNGTGSCLEAVANLQVRNSFAEQEERELAAFVRSIVERKASRKFPACGKLKIMATLEAPSSEINLTTESVTGDENEDFRRSSGENFREYDHGNRRNSYKTHKPRLAATSSTSVRTTRSGTLYFTASSKDNGRTNLNQCKIHDDRFRSNYWVDGNYESRKKSHRRNPKHTEESGDESYHRSGKKYPRSSVDRRRISGRRITRYRSSVVITL